MPTRDELVTAAVKAWREFQGPPCTPDPAIIRPDYIAFMQAMEALAADVADKPRVFEDPDTPPPDDVTHVRDRDDDVWNRTAKDGSWWWADQDVKPWKYITMYYGPLTEVRQDG